MLQMNAEIQLTYADPVPLEFSTATKDDLNLDPNEPEDPAVKPFYPSLGGGTLDYRLEEEEEFFPHVDGDANIDVFYVGGISTIVVWTKTGESPAGYYSWYPGPANGVANRDLRIAWVSDVRLGSYPFENDPPEEKERYARQQMRTIAHEVGHIICGLGHPDEKVGNRGPAPLDGTDYNQRLMRSGSKGLTLWGNRLVKGEWDAAEDWLVRIIDDQEP
jgi:hypothetical protein